jgi:hypothetical protein
VRSGLKPCPQRLEPVFLEYVAAGLKPRPFNTTKVAPRCKAGYSRNQLNPLAFAHERLGGAGGGYAVEIHFGGADHPVDVDEAVVCSLCG